MAARTVIEWITDQNTCFLLGAGCSICAGKPNMSRLTEVVKNEISEAGRKLLSDLKGRNGRTANVEDLMNYLLRMRELTNSRRTVFQLEEWTAESIETELLRMQKSIVKGVGTEWKPSSHHRRFLARLGSTWARRPIDIFSVNYDTVLEASLESLRLQYADGFVGSENAYFEPTVFDKIPDSVPFFRIYKLHGSVNWVTDDEKTVRRRPSYSLGGESRAVIYPAEQKHVQTQYGIYEIMMRRFRDRLRDADKNNKLVILGYSLGDEHINYAIEDSIRASGSNLTVHAFVGPEEDIEGQRSRLEAMANRCDHRFNAVIGNNYHVGPALDGAVWQEIAQREVWKFEHLVDLLAGAVNE
jgi:hypothetical protein